MRLVPRPSADGYAGKHTFVFHMNGHTLTFIAYPDTNFVNSVHCYVYRDGARVGEFATDHHSFFIYVENHIKANFYDPPF